MATEKATLSELKSLIKKIVQEDILIERYKWKPSASQRREFAKKMDDPEERAVYEKNKEDKATKKRSGSRFDYHSAGGNYIPTKIQHDFVVNHMDLFKTTEEETAANQVLFGYINKEKIHHDYIHVVNEKIRKWS